MWHIAAWEVASWWGIDERDLVYGDSLFGGVLACGGFEGCDGNAVQAFVPRDTGLLLEDSLERVKGLAELGRAEVISDVRGRLAWTSVLDAGHICVGPGVGFKHHEAEALVHNVVVVAWNWAGENDVVLESCGILVDVVKP